MSTNYRLIGGNTRIPRSAGVEELLDLWQAGDRKRIAVYLKSRSPRYTLEFALHLAEQTELENLSRLISLM